KRLASFTLVTQITAAVNMIGQALFQARLPEIGAAFGRRQHRHGARLVVQTTLLGLGLVVAAYATLFVVLCGLDVPLPEAYRPSLTVLLVAAAANLCFSIHLQGVQILRNLKRTGTQAGSTLFSAGVTVAMSFALGAALGETGLMIALAAGFAVQAASSNWLAVRALRAAGRAAR
ncbi:MAG: hypothetical protein KGY81_04050, partial [Phycisphaerae bacterium]|nr:hypothetical protein [Phycisphaerae bacterium]